MNNGPLDIDVDTLGNLRPRSKVVLSLGSNVGDCAGNLSRAVELLADTPDLIIVDVSPVYQTRLEGNGPPQDDFLNLVVVAESTLEPMTILDRAHAIEQGFGRARTVPNGPRTLDIDIIMVGKRVTEEELELPHPRAHERAFVLVPWLDIDPLGEIAGQGPIAELAKHVDTSGISRRDDIVIPNPARS